MNSRVIETTADISAPIDSVWRVLTDFPSFSKWSRFILGIDGQPRAGTRVSVRLDDGGGAMTIRPVVLVCAPHELRWCGVLGASFVFSGEHYFRLHPLPGGGTRLIHAEIFSGLFVPLLWKRLNSSTRRGFQDFNNALRERAEALTRPEGRSA